MDLLYLIDFSVGFPALSQTSAQGFLQVACDPSLVSHLWAELEPVRMQQMRCCNVYWVICMCFAENAASHRSLDYFTFDTIDKVLNFKRWRPRWNQTYRSSSAFLLVLSLFASTVSFSSWQQKGNYNLRFKLVTVILHFGQSKKPMHSSTISWIRRQRSGILGCSSHKLSKQQQISFSPFSCKVHRRPQKFAKQNIVRWVVFVIK